MYTETRQISGTLCQQTYIIFYWRLGQQEDLIDQFGRGAFCPGQHSFIYKVLQEIMATDASNSVFTSWSDVLNSRLHFVGSCLRSFQRSHHITGSKYQACSPPLARSMAKTR